MEYHPTFMDKIDFLSLRWQYSSNQSTGSA